jgi:hypothetical protein
MFKVHGIKSKLIVSSLACHTVSTDGQRTGKYMPAVIIRMLSDKIHTARGKISPNIALFTKELIKLF